MPLAFLIGKLEEIGWEQSLGKKKTSRQNKPIVIIVILILLFPQTMLMYSLKSCNSYPN